MMKTTWNAYGAMETNNNGWPYLGIYGVMGITMMGSKVGRWPSFNIHDTKGATSILNIKGFV